MECSVGLIGESNVMSEASPSGFTILECFGKCFIVFGKLRDYSKKISDTLAYCITRPQFAFAATDEAQVVVSGQNVAQLVGSLRSNGAKRRAIP